MPIPNQQELTRTSGVDTANASVTAISAPSGGQRIKVFELFVNVKTSEELIMKSGSTEIQRFYFGDNSGANLNYGNAPMVLNANEALVFTKGTATTPLSYAIKYIIEA